MIHPFPGIEVPFTVKTEFSGSAIYRVSTILTLFMLLRFYLLFRVFGSKYIEFKAYASYEGDAASFYLFRLKCIFEENPLRFLVFTFLLSVLSFALILRAC